MAAFIWIKLRVGEKLKLTVVAAALAFMVIGAPVFGEQFLKSHNPAESDFLTSIERVGPCKISTPPVAGIRVPYQLYPPWSVQFHEEGTVQMELVFDEDWCIRKASIVQSTGFWRLDEVSLKYMMTVKYQPKPGSIKDGSPTMVVKLGWGASQGKK